MKQLIASILMMAAVAAASPASAQTEVGEDPNPSPSSVDTDTSVRGPICEMVTMCTNGANGELSCGPVLSCH